jgi:hypothetical protein
LSLFLSTWGILPLNSDGDPRKEIYSDRLSNGRHRQALVPRAWRVAGPFHSSAVGDLRHAWRLGQAWSAVRNWWPLLRILPANSGVCIGAVANRLIKAVHWSCQFHDPNW